MNRKEQIKQIIQYLLDSPRFDNYSRANIEQAIRVVRLVLDQRTIDNWFNLLWKLGYLNQPEPGIYGLNISKIQELEVRFPFENDPNQRRLNSV